jgi:hypothetical protein
MTYVGVRALGGVKLLTANDEALQFSFQGGEFVLSDLDLEELGGKQLADVGTRRDTFTAQIENGADF